LAPQNADFGGAKRYNIVPEAAKPVDFAR